MSQGSIEGGGIPQSSKPGTGAGRSKDLIRVNSSGGSSVALLEEGISSFDNVDDPDAWALLDVGMFSTRSSDMWARGWLFISGGRRITTLDLAGRPTVNSISR